MDGAQLINENNQHLIGTQIQTGSAVTFRNDGETSYSMQDLQDSSPSRWRTFAGQGIVTRPASSDLSPPITMTEFSSLNGSTPEVLLKNGDCVVFTTEDGTGWHCKSGQTLSFSFEKYPSEYNSYQNITVGYICDGILYEGAIFSKILDTYKIKTPITGNYEIYIISGASDYLGLKEGRITLG